MNDYCRMHLPEIIVHQFPYSSIINHQSLFINSPIHQSLFINSLFINHHLVKKLRRRGELPGTFREPTRDDG